ncbi:MAG TPA: DUF5615 family PIN-like protein [Tepidiformaceae bacterium]|nr:DUF5615 family PIN-like protein [Tepidiformaceae bacterium]
MDPSLRLLLDENVSQEIAGRLRGRGIDVVTVVEAGRASMADPDQLGFARASGRILVTHDRGLRDRHWEEQPHAGVLFIPQRVPVSLAVEWLEMAAFVLTADEMVNRLEMYRP